VKRLGGGFGGKETRPPLVACAAAIAADHLNRPVRLALSREDDMKSIGKRHDIFSDYSLSVSDNGQIHGWKQHFYTDGGCTVDVSQSVMDLILLSADNAYNVPTYFVEGDVCRTNKASNTAMRSFGVVQMMVAIEEAVEKAAYTLGMRPETLREQNFYDREGDFAPYGAPLHECLVNDIWQKLKVSSNFEERVQDIERFNQDNRWRKRGISMMPLKYGVSYTYDTLDQGAALLNVYYDDGTILLQHGGVEMGQGIHTKMGQIAAYQLNVPFEKIRVGKNDTDVLPNTSSTGASTGTDLNGGAVINAAQKLRTRLEHYIQGLRDTHGDAWCVKNGVNYWNYEAGWRATVQVNGHSVLMWDHIVQMAYNDRIDLSSHGFFRYEHLTPVDDANPYGTPFFYYNYAACCSEVEINVLTGDFTILRTDILYDTGKSINPCVDIGQIEGGFVQGIGYVTTEELIFNEAGQLVTDNTWTYKPPGSKTIPVDFRVALNRSRRKAIHSGDDVDTDGIKSSKTTGEPPLVLATTVFFAIKHAILAARHDQGITGWFDFPAPATTQAIQQACLVNSDNMTL
jgi:xanthine dehydrogenase/oxidase